MGAIKRKLIEKQEEQYAQTQLLMDTLNENEEPFDDWEDFKQEELAREKWEGND